jgi:putative DeoR family transcriptional regulator (stage III sporulation protein D)
MREDLYERVILEARYILKHNATVRATAKVFGVGKSTVHKDMTERLQIIDKQLFSAVKAVFFVNLSERHIRGGEATRRKFKKT